MWRYWRELEFAGREEISRKRATDYWQTPDTWNLCVESAWPWTMWLLWPHDHGENRWVHCASTSHSGEERERNKDIERDSFLSWDYISQAWKRPEAFPKWPINFPSFCGLLIGLQPLATLTDLFGQAPPSALPNNLVSEHGREEN